MEYRFSESMKLFQSSAVRDILKLTQGRSIISFAGGLPAEELFPIEAVKNAAAAAFDQGKGALQYGLTEGYTPLREALAERMAAKGMNVTANEMILTTGSQQVIDLLTRVYIDPGDVILVQQPTYLAALQVFQARGAKVVSVAGDENGPDLEDTARKIAEYKPKMLYAVPTFSNPTGFVWSLDRREGILNLCTENDILLLEDDPYGELQYGSEETYPSIFSLRGSAQGSPVVYTSTFSKTVAPALRTGWAIGDPAVIRMMAQAKQAADLHSSTLDQQTLYQLLVSFDLDAHIRLIRRHYEDRMRLMTKLLGELDVPGLKWNEPKGGMFLWLQLPEGLKAETLMVKAVEEGVAFVPGSTFFADNPQYNTIRMNFTHSNPEEMKLGMERLERAMKACLASAV
ncbi:aminotransferase [Paenibacillus sp. J31TS4]|uniref:aminotransferase-like domain-containing protein n=1 Tax=Paenibacillus sp. J31TS4 TaxID=2807195 RepID=UPI001B05248B|nr:PLP-dependent aminotransferase family protein [Paenibacillus sp. J31TS4]GIP38879.1 aminotransferase [Paenibacillus sp. J31TS4]